MSFSQLRIHDLSGGTILVFGVLAFVMGVVGLINPEFMLNTLQLDILEQGTRAEGDYTLAFLTASSMASFNMGIYYILAALTNTRIFYWWTVPFRIVTFSVFTLAVMRGIAPDAFYLVGAWELVGALLTGSALLYERRKSVE